MGTQIVTATVSQLVAPTPATLQKTGAMISQGGTITAPGTISLLTGPSDLTPLLNGAFALSTLAWSATVVTATAAAAHGFTVGDTVELTITGAKPAGYNGTVIATITTTTAFTYSVTTNPGTMTVPGVYTVEDVAELLSMVTTFFAQGAFVSVYVLELGAGNTNDGVADLSAYITATPNFFYSYLVPREWDSNANYLALLATFESPSAKTYFFTTTTLSTYKNYTALMKCCLTLIEAPTYGQWTSNTLTAISYSGGLVTATTTTAHGVQVGQYFQITGVVPVGYNGWFQAVTGTTGSTLIYAVPAALGAETALGTLVPSYMASAGIPATEFSMAAAFWKTLSYSPGSSNQVTPLNYSYVYGVTPFPQFQNGALLTILKASAINVISTGAEGGITNTILTWGTTMDNRKFNYWYSADWVQINVALNVTNAIINGSNDPVNPLFYNQPGINVLENVVARTMNNGCTFGLVLFTAIEVGLDGPVLDQAINIGTYTGYSVVNAVPFITYSQENPGDYKIGRYAGLSVEYTPTNGFDTINFNLVISDFVAP